MSERVKELLRQLTCVPVDAARADMSVTGWPSWWTSATSEERLAFWSGVRQLNDQRQLNTTRLNQRLRQADAALVPRDSSDASTVASAIAAEVSHIYRHWSDETVTRHLLLVTLSSCGVPSAWRELADLIASDPPVDPRQATEVFLPLFRDENGPVDVLFPRLLDALQHLSVAAMVLDLANFIARQGRLPDHPARPRAAELTWLLGQLVERLEGYEQACQEVGVRDLQVARHVQESVALAVALTHTLALLDHREATGKFFRMLDLQHRRLRVEAAAALARFGESAGRQALVEMVAEPLVRLHVRAYAQELGMLDALPQEFLQPQAMAEAELTLRLAEPDLFGIPPSSCELVDQRVLAWPGYTEPQSCYLFRYTYHLAGADYINVAMAGPAVQAIVADLTSLPPADIYALYAGSQVEHDELRRDDFDSSDPAQVQAAARLQQSLLTNPPWQSLTPRFWGECFGDRGLVASAVHGTVAGTLVLEDSGYAWFPEGNPRRPLDADLAFALFVGRRLLMAFNDDFPGDSVALTEVGLREPSVYGYGRELGGLAAERSAAAAEDAEGFTTRRHRPSDSIFEC